MITTLAKMTKKKKTPSPEFGGGKSGGKGAGAGPTGPAYTSSAPAGSRITRDYATPENLTPEQQRNIKEYGKPDITQSDILKKLYALQSNDPHEAMAMGYSPTAGVGKTVPTELINQQEEAKQNLINQIGPPQSIPNLQQPINQFDLASAGAAGMGGALAGAKTGAMIGSAVPGVGNIAGAIGGGIIGGGSAFLIKIGIDQKQDVKKAYSNYKSAKTNMGTILNWANNPNKYGKSKAEIIAAWQEEKSILYASERNLHDKTQSELLDFLGKPGDEYAQVEGFMRLMDDNDNFLRMALSAPNLNEVDWSTTEAGE